jgi:hypothetical protein
MLAAASKASTPCFWASSLMMYCTANTSSAAYLQVPQPPICG